MLESLFAGVIIFDFIFSFSYFLKIFFASMKIKTTHNLQFSMPFAAEMDIKSSGSSYERH